MRGKQLLKVFILLLGVFWLAGCGQSKQADTNQPKDAKAIIQSIRMGGSSTLSPIVAECANSFTDKYKTWDKVDAKLTKDPIVLFVSTGGSGFGVKSAIDGTFDIGLVAREITAEEKAKMPEGKIYNMGSDVLTIAVNPQNPVVKIKPNLTLNEIKAIFAGEIKTWKQLDAQLSDRPIVVAVRDVGGGASQVFDENVMKGTPICKEAIQIPSMGALANKVMENVNAIGYVSSGLVKQNKDKISVLSVEGVAPTDENINGGKYKIARPLLVITKTKPSSEQQLFIDYLMSDSGRKVVEEMGYVLPSK